MKVLKEIFKFSLPLILIGAAGTFVGCVEPPKDEDPVSALNSLARDYGYIGFEDPLENAGTGTMVGGRPDAISFVAHKNDCFPEDQIERHFDRSEFNRTHSYTYQGNLGFLTSGNSVVSAGFGLRKEHSVNINLSGITIEYMSSIDITDHYQEGMSETCRQYLDDVGFIIQSLSSESFTLSIEKAGGLNVGLNTGNISQFFSFETGVSWEIVDKYTVEVTTPKYLGYQLGRMRLEDNGRSLWRAVEAVNDKYVFERIALFDDVDAAIAKAQKFLQADSLVDQSEHTDNNAVYND